jgi:hypothetical protein
MAQRKTVQKEEVPVISHNMRGIALAAMIVGIVGVVFSWAPFWGFVISATGLVLGIIALVKRAPNHGMALAGTILGGAGILLNITIVIGLILLVGTLSPTPHATYHPQPQYYYNY